MTKVSKKYKPKLVDRYKKMSSCYFNQKGYARKHKRKKKNGGKCKVKGHCAGKFKTKERAMKAWEHINKKKIKYQNKHSSAAAANMGKFMGSIG
jgi:phosphopantetheinyl transferase (holo-ACP synthase)